LYIRRRQPLFPKTRIKIANVRDHANDCTDLVVERQKYNLPHPSTQCMPEDVEKQVPNRGNNLSPTADEEIYKI
jgi:hypothetical protein